MPRLSYEVLRAKRQTGYVSISDLASRLGVSLRTLRFYEQEGLVSPKREGHHRWYSEKDVVILKLVIIERQLGHSLYDIGKFISRIDGDDPIKFEEQIAKRISHELGILQSKRANILSLLQEP